MKQEREVRVGYEKIRVDLLKGFVSLALFEEKVKNDRIWIWNSLIFETEFFFDYFGNVKKFVHE